MISLSLDFIYSHLFTGKLNKNSINSIKKSNVFDLFDENRWDFCDSRLGKMAQSLAAADTINNLFHKLIDLFAAAPAIITVWIIQIIRGKT